VSNTKAAIQRLESRLEAEKARIAEYSRSKQDEVNQRLQDAILGVQVAETNLKQSTELIREKEEEANSLRRQGDGVEGEIQTARNAVIGFQEQIQRCTEQQNNSLAPYGRDIKKVLERIKGMRWHGQMPLGPLGVYVKAKDRVWADLLRTTLGGHMASFAVTDGRDLHVLKKLLRESGKYVELSFPVVLLMLTLILSPNSAVFVSEVDLFDYRDGEPDPQYPTILRVIDVSYFLTLA
jgi:chromosome segregation ATPase